MPIYNSGHAQVIVYNNYCVCTYYFFVWFRVLKELVDHPDKMVLMDLEALLDQGEVLENKDLPDLQ